MVVHGFVVVVLMKWVEGEYWIPLLLGELFVGQFIAYSLFDVPAE
jgi:hypothetical protein